jgi:hypothetical protein
MLLIVVCRVNQNINKRKKDIKMIREIKSIQLGSTYDFIDLSKYTNNKESIKITFENTGEEFTQWYLSDFGNIIIENGIIDYKQYKDIYRINMIVEYEPSELPLSLQGIDTLEGLKKNIIDLKSLDYISSIRLVASRKFDMRLNQFVLFNTILFDQFGQSMKLKYNNQDRYDYSFNKIVTFDEFKDEVKEYSYGSGAIPKYNDTCPHCKQKWNLSNLRDCVQRGEFVYHVDCNRFSLYEEVKKEFHYIASRVYKSYDLNAVKNGYGSEEYNGSWFIINTSDGDIKIGWRKRVIQIEWLDNYKKFKYNAEKEDVTKEFSNRERYIHAWSIEKAIEYLKEAKRSIIK